MNVDETETKSNNETDTDSDSVRNRQEYELQKCELAGKTKQSLITNKIYMLHMTHDM